MIKKKGFAKIKKRTGKTTINQKERISIVTVFDDVKEY